MDYYAKGLISYIGSPQGILTESDICDVDGVLVERICADPLNSSKNFVKYNHV